MAKLQTCKTLEHYGTQDENCNPTLLYPLQYINEISKFVNGCTFILQICLLMKQDIEVQPGFEPRSFECWSDALTFIRPRFKS